MFLSSMTQAVARLFASTGSLDSDCIDHPLIQGMSLRELADLPFPRPEAPEPLADLPQAAHSGSSEPETPVPGVLSHAA